MAGSSRSKRRPKLEPISPAELASDPTMTGFTSVFNIATSLPQDGATVSSAPPDGIRGAVTKRDTVVKKDTVTIRDAVVEGDAEVERVAVSQFAPILPADPIVRANFGYASDGRKIRRCVIVQDGHSAAEEILYQALWNSARSETKESKLITIGWRMMAKLARLTPRNAKLNCQRLIEKLAVEPVSAEISAQRIGHTYRIHSYRAILERRRAAGLEWVIRHRGVEFVAPPASINNIEKDTVPLSITVAERGTDAGVTRDTGTAFERGIGTGVERDTPLRKTNSNRIVTSSSSAELVTKALRQYLGDTDDDAVSQLIARCQDIAPDVTTDEIVHFIKAKANTPGIRSRMAFLLVAIPRCLEGESFRQFRDEQRQNLERQKKQLDETISTVKQILNDPNSPPEDREWAAQTLLRLQEQHSAGEPPPT